MTNREIYIPPGGPPRIPPPSKEIYALMGEENIFKMLHAVYAEFAQSSISYMFPEGEELKEAADKSGAFFVGLCGGPPLYHQRYGAPMLRGRHMPFVIDDKARLEWLRCFDLVLDDAVEQFDFPEQHLATFRTFLHGFSTWMVNAK